MRLDVHVIGTEQRLRPRDGRSLDDVHEFAAAVIALSRITFGVLVREHRAGRLEHRAAHEIFRCDQFEAVVLAVNLVLDRISDLRIRFRKRSPDDMRCFNAHASFPVIVVRTFRPALQHSSFSFRDLIQTPLMPPACKRRREPERQNFVGETERDYSGAHGEHVRVVVLPGKPCGVQVVAQRRANSPNFVRGYLLTLTAPAEYDAAIGPSLGHRLGDGDANGRVVHGRFALCAVIIDECPSEASVCLKCSLSRNPA